jgi:hypothetical protein
MTPDLTRRCGLALFAASALAMGIGFLATPNFDPTAPLRFRLGPWWPGALLTAAALMGGQFALRHVARRLHPGWVAAALRAALWAAWGLAASLWLLASWANELPDGRALLWLALSPLWVMAAGLCESGRADSNGRGRRDPPQRLPHRRHRARLVDEVNVRTGADVLVPRAGEQRIRSREDDVVAMPVDAHEQLTA